MTDIGKPQTNVEIVSDGTPHGTSVLVDGKPMDCVMAINVRIRPNDLVVVYLELASVRLKIKGQAKIKQQEG